MEKKTIALVIKTTKLDANVLKAAMWVYLNHSRQKNTENAGLNFCEKVGWKRRGSFICRSDGR